LIDLDAGRERLRIQIVVGEETGISDLSFG